MTDKERGTDQIIDDILSEIRAQRQKTETSPEPPAPRPPQANSEQPEPAAPRPEKPVKSEKSENPEKSEQSEKPAVEQLWPEPKLADTGHRPLADDDLIDERFREFFTTTVAVDHSEMKRAAHRPQNDNKGKKKGLFSRLFAKNEDGYEEDEDEEDEAGFEDDAYAEDADDDAAPPPPRMPENIFAPQPVRPQPEPSAAPRRETIFAPEPVPTIPAPQVIPEPAPATPAPQVIPEPVPATPASQVIPEPMPATPAPQPTSVPEMDEPACPVMARGAVSPEEIEERMEKERCAPPIQPENVAPIGGDIFAEAGIFAAVMGQSVPETAAPGEGIPAGAAVDEDPTQEHEIPRRTVFSQTEEDEEDGEEQPEEEPEDYETPGDAAAVEENLKGLRSGLTLRFIVTALLAGFLLYITLASAYPALPMLHLMTPAAQPRVYLVVCALLTALCIAVNWPTVAGGICSVAGDPNPDIAPAFAAVFAELQCIFLIVNADKFAAGGYTPFCGLAALALAVNVLGKSMTCRIVQDNFVMTSAAFDHAAAYLVPDAKLARKVTAGLGEDEPRLLASRPTALVKGFLRQSFSEHPTDLMAKRFGIAAAAVSVVCGVAVFVMQKDLLAAVSCMAGAMCLATPLAGTLVGAVPFGLMQSAAARVGAIIPGPSAVEQLCQTNVVLLDAKDLFPTGCVVLRGIRTFQKERIDLAILYAASILIEGCDTMRDIFLGVVGGKREMLYKVENLTCETGRGFVGWIEGNRIIVGSRAILQAYDIDLPSMDYEKKYTGDDKQPVYLAVSGRLFGMFLVSYTPSAEVQETIDELRRTGLSLLVRSTDFGLSKKLIADCYGLPADSVKVLDEAGEAALAPQLAYLPASEGVMTHMGSFSSFAGGLHAAQAESAAERSAGMVQAASVILALLLTLLLSFTAGLAHLSVLAVLLYQLAWLILTLAAPLLKKY